VGQFSAELILVRGAGAPDVVPSAEPRVREAARLLYDLPGEPGLPELTRIAEAWRPLRSWVCVLLRARLAEEG
jgi:DNA-3-methyladenine glycosylase II